MPAEAVAEVQVRPQRRPLVPQRQPSRRLHRRGSGKGHPRRPSIWPSTPTPCATCDRSPSSWSESRWIQSRRSFPTTRKPKRCSTGQCTAPRNRLDTPVAGKRRVLHITWSRFLGQSLVWGAVWLIAAAGRSLPGADAAPAAAPRAGTLSVGAATISITPDKPVPCWAR